MFVAISFKICLFSQPKKFSVFLSNATFHFFPFSSHPCLDCPTFSENGYHIVIQNSFLCSWRIILFPSKLLRFRISLSLLYWMFEFRCWIFLSSVKRISWSLIFCTCFILRSPICNSYFGRFVLLMTKFYVFQQLIINPFISLSFTILPRRGPLLFLSCQPLSSNDYNWYNLFPGIKNPD